MPARPDPYRIAHWPKPDAPATDPWEKRFLAASSDEERVEIISEKATSDPKSLAPLLRRALQSESLAVGVEAINSSYGLRGANAIDILSGATSHTEEEIAILAAEAAREQPDLETRLEIYENFLASPHEPVRELAVIELSRQESKPAIDLLILGLLDPSAAIVDTTQQSLQRLFAREFLNAAEAKQWWAANQDKYGPKLQNIAVP